MSIYILILFGTFFMFVQSISKGKDRINHEIELDIYLFLLCLFLCFGYTTGTDWRSYEQAYGWVATEYKNLFLFQGHYKIFCVNGNTGFRNESRIFYFIHLQNEEAYERKESSSA